MKTKRIIGLFMGIFVIFGIGLVTAYDYNYNHNQRGEYHDWADYKQNNFQYVYDAMKYGDPEARKALKVAIMGDYEEDDYITKKYSEYSNEKYYDKKYYEKKDYGYYKEGLTTCKYYFKNNHKEVTCYGNTKTKWQSARSSLWYN